MRQFGKLILCGLVFGGFMGSSLLIHLVLCCASSARRKKQTIALTQFGARALLLILGIKTNPSPRSRRLTTWPAQISLLPLSYVVGEDEDLYCSVKCADAGEQRTLAEAAHLPRTVSASGTDSVQA